MSSVVRPSGPLAPGVYWVRRLVLVLVLVAIAALVWLYLPRPGGDGKSSAGSAELKGSSEGSANSPLRETSPAGPTALPDRSEESGGEDRRPASEGRPSGPTPGNGKNGGASPSQGQAGKPDRKPLASPTGTCEPTEVSVEIVVANTEAGDGTAARLHLTSEVEPACTLAITADSLALRVTSGTDTVWTSQECPDSVLSQQLVVRRERSTAYTFDWDGKRSVVSCQTPGEVAAAGGYWLEAALVGADVEKAYFEVA